MKALSSFSLRALRRFARDEAGAVTVDWVVLTAALVALVMSVFVILNASIFENASVAIVGGIEEAVNMN